MRDQLLALQELSRIDLGFRQIEADQGDVQAALADVRDAVGRMQDLLQREKDRVAEAEKLKSSTAAEVVDLGERIARSTARHNAARNSRERDATQRELEVMRREREERSKKIDELGMVVRDVQGSIARHEGEFAELQKVLADQEANANQSNAEFEQRRAALETERSHAAKAVRADLFRRYEIVRAKRANALASLEGSRCSGCHMLLPPRLVQQLHAGNEVHQCPSCQRILFIQPTETAR